VSIESSSDDIHQSSSSSHEKKKTKKQVQKVEKNEVKNDPKNDVKNEVKNDPKNEVKNEPKNEPKYDVKNDKVEVNLPKIEVPSKNVDSKVEGSPTFNFKVDTPPNNVDTSQLSINRSGNSGGSTTALSTSKGLKMARKKGGSNLVLMFLRI